MLRRLPILTRRHARSLLRSMPVAGMSTMASDRTTTEWSSYHKLFATVVAGVTLTAFTASCEAPKLTPTQVATEAFPTGGEKPGDDDEEHPVYTSDQVAENDGTDGKPIWMSYGGVVYDVTDFIANHPGGSEKVSCCNQGAFGDLSQRTLA